MRILVLLLLALPSPVRADATIPIEQPPANQRLMLLVTAAGKMRLSDEKRDADEAHVKQRLAAAVAHAPDLTLTIAADKRVSYDSVIRAIDVARQAGVKHIGMAVSPE